MMMAVKEDASDAGKNYVMPQKVLGTYLQMKMAGKLFPPKELRQNLESTPRLRGSTWEVVTDGAYTVYSAVWLIDYS